MAACSIGGVVLRWLRFDDNNPPPKLKAAYNKEGIPLTKTFPLYESSEKSDKIRKRMLSDPKHCYFISNLTSFYDLCQLANLTQDELNQKLKQSPSSAKSVKDYYLQHGTFPPEWDTI